MSYHDDDGSNSVSTIFPQNVSLLIDKSGNFQGSFRLVSMIITSFLRAAPYTILYLSSKIQITLGTGSKSACESSEDARKSTSSCYIYMFFKTQVGDWEVDGAIGSQRIAPQCSFHQSDTCSNMFNVPGDLLTLLFCHVLVHLPHGS